MAGTISVFIGFTVVLLNLRRKGKKRLPSRDPEPLVVPSKPNECWSMDFMSDNRGVCSSFHLNAYLVQAQEEGICNIYYELFLQRTPLLLPSIQNRTLSQSQAKPFFATLVGTQFRDEGVCWHYNKVKHTSAIDQKQRYSIN
jgi:hypothetical protein